MWWSDAAAHWRWRDLPLRVKGVMVVTIPMIPLVLTILLGYSSQRRADGAERLVSQTREVKAQLDRMLTLLVEAELGARAYLLTRDPETLARIRSASVALVETLRSMAVLISDDKPQMERLRKIPAISQGRPISSIIEYAQKSPPGAPAPTELLKRSRDTVTRLRVALQEMQNAQDVLIEARSTRARAARRQALMVTGGGVALGLVGGLVAALLFVSGIARRIALVSTNARRLAVGDPLMGMPEGRDEVGELAGSLTEAATLLGQRDAELQRRMAELSTANTELEAFSYSVSHDLRAPLRHISGFAALLEKRSGNQLDVESGRYLQTIVGAAIRMGRLVDDLLTFSRMGRAEIRQNTVNLDDLVREIVSEAGLAAGSRRIQWVTQPLPVVAGDPAMLRLALTNLVANAVKYTSRCEVAEIEIGAKPAVNGERIVYVRDNGVGFDMAYADKLFGVFQRLHGSDDFEGTGIGLANVRRIVQRHGGTTWAEGAVDRGATFFISLPA